MNIKVYGMKVFFLFVFIANIFPQEDKSTDKIRGAEITKTFGSFSIPDDWIEITRYSRNGKYFYSHNSASISSRMTNISIEQGTNPYALEDHMTFRYAILRQMLMQAGNAEVYGSGTFTERDDPLYIFTIEDKEEDVTTIQYYIIGDKKHILVHLTDFHDGTITNANEVSRFQNQLTVRSRALLKPAFVLFQALRALQKYFFIGSDFKIAILKSPQVAEFIVNSFIWPE